MFLCGVEGGPTEPQHLFTDFYYGISLYGASRGEQGIYMIIDLKLGQFMRRVPDSAIIGRAHVSRSHTMLYQFGSVTKYHHP